MRQGLAQAQIQGTLNRNTGLLPLFPQAPAHSVTLPPAWSAHRALGTCRSLGALRTASRARGWA